MPRASGDGACPTAAWASLCLVTLTSLQLKEAMDDGGEDEYIDDDDYEFDSPSSSDEGDGE